MGLDENNLTRPIAPEDLRVGDYVGVLTYVLQSEPCCPDDWMFGRVVEAARTPVYLPTPVVGRVRALCLPFVLVRSPSKGRRLLDVRLVTFGRLDAEFGRAVFDAATADRKRAAARRQKRS